MSDAGRTEAAAKAIHHAEWTDGGFRELDAETCWTQDPDDHKGYYESVETILAAADGYDREHGIVRVQVDDAAIARVADALGPRIAVNRNVTKAARAAIAALVAPVGAQGEPTDD
jgi:hypothetical protein